MIGAVANTEWGWTKDTLTKLYNCQLKTIMHYGAPAWQPWISETNVATLERMDQRALRMITGQCVGSPCEAIRVESGVTSFETIRKRNILTARERALRCTEDHPARIAASNDGIRQRIKIRKGFRHTAEQLSEYLPPQSTNRRPIDLTVPPPWEKHGNIQVTAADANMKKATTDNNLLRESTLEEIRKEEADYILYSDGSAVGGTLDGGSAVVITRGTQRTWKCSRLGESREVQSPARLRKRLQQWNQQRIGYRRKPNQVPKSSAAQTAMPCARR